MIATETGPQLLQEGIFIKGQILAGFLDLQGERILPLIERAEIEKSAAYSSELASADADNNLVLFKIHD